MHVGYEETSQSKILKCQICVQKRGVCIILRKGQLKGPSKHVQLTTIKDYQFVLVIFYINSQLTAKRVNTNYQS